MSPGPNAVLEAKPTQLGFKAPPAGSWLVSEVFLSSCRKYEVRLNTACEEIQLMTGMWTNTLWAAIEIFTLWPSSCRPSAPDQLWGRTPSGHGASPGYREKAAHMSSCPGP
ncbi:hypothetical protein EYF80_044642 [Liparis tanakae]|uniref:Uncharacterized protein n=1 Tax=Liparis tanakae TaxID=230148 RepID=A0A4Z2FVB4_9TELE|nr:hypothetical protein EYF80_044642 [Liparis tanakae]